MVDLATQLGIPVFNNTPSKTNKPKKPLRLISHRGNIDGPVFSYENEPKYIMEALDEGYNVMVDTWYNPDDAIFMTGRDFPKYKIKNSILTDNRIHLRCLNMHAFVMYLKGALHEEESPDAFILGEDIASYTKKGVLWLREFSFLPYETIACKYKPTFDTDEDLDYYTHLCTNDLIDAKEALKDKRNLI